MPKRSVLDSPAIDRIYRRLRRVIIALVASIDAMAEIMGTTMTRQLSFLSLILACAFLSPPLVAQGLEASPGIGPGASQLTTEIVRYQGRSALRVLDKADGRGECCLVSLPSGNFHDGVIEALVAGRPKKGASAAARGFIGIAFRVAADRSRYEAFYLRPTNGRADDQLRRNHATQYISEPEFPWEKLRAEVPGQYESYADMEPGVWTKLRIEVLGSRARFYVNRSPQPVLIVNDLKLGAAASGGIALWVGSETDGYFADVRVTRQVNKSIGDQ